jgi:hypothetical protein
MRMLEPYVQRRGNYEVVMRSSGTDDCAVLIGSIFVVAAKISICGK